MSAVRRLPVVVLAGALAGLPGPAAAVVPREPGEPAEPVVTAADAWVDYGRSARLRVTVSADGGTPTGAVTARLGDRTLGSADLDDGSAVVAVPARALLPRATPYPVTVTYDGDGEVAAGEDAAALKVRRGRVIVWATVTPRRPVVREGRVSAVVEVLNADGVARAGTVRLSAKGAGVRRAPLRGGRATLRLPPFRSRGPRNVVVAYGGSALLRPARATYRVRVVAGD